MRGQGFREFLFYLQWLRSVSTISRDRDVKESVAASGVQQPNHASTVDVFPFMYIGINWVPKAHAGVEK